ncbi:hypothetical protein Sango_2924500 [Sesamum angolense]|uniref:DUF4283 domain-containing protein n=1 Tax=Sesamum angolense TaxID=2727404 RepID=A0AAE1VVF8_9LAMI|nr:hypothetical protein Sango_2924500 [Sesamum angolense]
MMTPWASHRPLEATASDALTAAPSKFEKLPRFSALLTTPTPLTATSIDAEDGLLPPRPNHAPLTHPSPPWASPPCVDVWASSPPILAVSTVNVHQPPSANSMLELNGSFLHQSPTVSSPPTPFVQPAVARAPSPSWDRVELPQQHPALAPLPTPQFRPQPPAAAPPAATAAPAKPLPEFFIAKNPQLHPTFGAKRGGYCSSFYRHDPCGSHRWNTTAVGYFLGKKPYFHHLNEFVRSIWPGVRDVKATSNGFFFFQFETVATMEDVIEGVPWLYLGQPIVLQKWESGMVLRKLKHTEVPIWIKLRHLPVELWTTEGLSTVASGIG